MDSLIHTILRSYTGVFVDDIYIDESMLATRIGKSKQEVYEMLKTLSKLRYVNYIPAKKTPFIIFTSSREENHFVSIPKSIYEERKQRFENRIYSMIDYVERKEVCRSRILLIYFGEKDTNDCGRCDICLKKNDIGLTNFEFRQIDEQITDLFKKKGIYRLNELVDNFKEGLNTDDRIEKVIKAIRFKIDVGELKLEGDRIFLPRRT
jgi:ATP-dependent DNA helicase RecQ